MPKPPAAPAIVITQSVQSHLPPHDLSLNSSAEAMPTPARRAAYQQPSDSSPIRIPPERCCHLWDSWNQCMMFIFKTHRVISYSIIPIFFYPANISYTIVASVSADKSFL